MVIICGGFCTHAERWHIPSKFSKKIPPLARGERVKAEKDIELLFRVLGRGNPIKRGRRHSATKPDIVDASTGVDVEAVGRGEEVRIDIEPGTAAKALSTILWVILQRPFPHIPGHAINAIVIRRKKFNINCAMNDTTFIVVLRFTMIQRPTLCPIFVPLRTSRRLFPLVSRGKISPFGLAIGSGFRVVNENGRLVWTGKDRAFRQKSCPLRGWMYYLVAI